jgi:hypothetical protein
MQSFGWAKIAVFYARKDPYAFGYREALEHAGIPFESIDNLGPRELARFHVLVLCGIGDVEPVDQSGLSDWVRKGGHLICSGSSWSIDSLLGLAPESRHVSSGYLMHHVPDRLWPEGTERTKFFGGTWKKPGECDVIATIDDGVGISRHRVGKGCTVFLAPHVGQTIRLMQSGRSVECDGIGPSDGSAILDNGTLRAEDGTVLDFEHDRTTVEGSDKPFFATPYSDIIREIFIRAIVEAADQSDLALPIFWHWPHNACGAAMLSVECEEFERDHVNLLHRMLSMFGMPAAWMVGLPGYPIDVYRTMRAWDHEVGLLFQTDDHSGWNEERMKILVTAITRLTGQAYVESARPQDGRWKNWNMFYDLCEASGARISLSKGGRQAGTSGFLFGTCHPFAPMRKDGSSYFVTEIPYATYNLGLMTPDAVADKLISETAARHGCFQMVLASDAIKHQSVGSAVRRALSVCKQNKLEFMLPEQVQRFERGRRQLRISQKMVGGEGTLLLTSDVALEGLTLLVGGHRMTAEVRGKEIPVEVVERYGARFNVIKINLEAKQQVELRLYPSIGVQAA